MLLLWRYHSEHPAGCCALAPVAYASSRRGIQRASVYMTHGAGHAIVTLQILSCRQKRRRRQRRQPRRRGLRQRPRGRVRTTARRSARHGAGRRRIRRLPRRSTGSSPCRPATHGEVPQGAAGGAAAAVVAAASAPGGVPLHRGRRRQTASRRRQHPACRPVRRRCGSSLSLLEKTNNAICLLTC